MTEQIVGLVVVTVFAFVNGMNDGGTLLATGLRSSTRPGWVRLLVLAVMLALAPALLGSQVAITLAERLVAFGDDTLPVLAAIVATMLVVSALTRLGMPTSLTLGLIGGIAGSGLAAGLQVDGRTIAVVFAVAAAAAPLVGLFIAVVMARLVLLLPGRLARGTRGAMLAVGHLLQALAYGVNDGQKMLAVAAIVGGTTAALPHVPVTIWAVIVLAFTVGTLAGIARIGPTIDAKVLPMRPEHVAVAQVSGALAVVGSAVVASPVSLIQALTGGLIGAGVSVTARRVRWAVVVQILLAWVVTLPACFAVGATLTLVSGMLVP